MSTVASKSPRPQGGEPPISHRWYVVRTQAHKERLAARHLGNQGFPTYLPEITCTVRHARQFRSVKRPLFPLYLFVAFDIAKAPWRSINGTRGVVHIIMSGERPTALPPGFVEMLMSMSDDRGEFSFSQHVRPGDRVRVEAGPFASFIGHLEKLDSGGRAQLLLNMMGREVRIWSDASHLSVA